ncbi:hypothetical protein [Mycolicibacterium confluentis]|uniref:Uncharacterized protein n=1 Tax=Mycolicibacterium confluentis TaxID=28047 RepID=A0A7I7XZ87_9MYCO|nr:hypothetical protein [Mycolicibacterium confluentis]MCV7319634.1 hypothetical protein [Mycolicibacterium confluentis]ORV34237.1 hypothetical protein AWB99_00955 [Mycolicibacterium confluentis]BBZ34658.1 hypothetical protein MCNF_32630 [Mycolicibacterium confluentis]
MKFTLIGRREGEHRRWPVYVLGWMRTSTIVLIIAFFALWWVYDNYSPSPEPRPAPGSQVVPPGFVPDPAYTWVPRTIVEAPRVTTTTPTTTTTTTTTPSPEPTTDTDAPVPDGGPTDTGEPPTPTTPTTPTPAPNPFFPVPPTTTPVLPGPVPSPTLPRAE